MIDPWARCAPMVRRWTAAHSRPVLAQAFMQQAKVNSKTQHYYENIIHPVYWAANWFCSRDPGDYMPPAAATALPPLRTRYILFLGLCGPVAEAAVSPTPLQLGLRLFDRCVVWKNAAKTTHHHRHTFETTRFFTKTQLQHNTHQRNKHACRSQQHGNV